MASPDTVTGSSMNGYIDIGLAERMITRYNGDKANLHVFIDNCNNAHSLLNPIYKLAFVSVALSKIDGNLRSTLLNRNFTSWQELKDHLLENYSEKRTFAQWQLELNSCRQNFNEPVLNYSNRIENCYIKLIKALNPKLSKEAREANVELLKNQALNIFISGLNQQLHILLKSQKPSTFEEAVSIAISEEQEIKSRQEMNAKRYDKGPKKCSNCNMIGHLAFQCRKNTSIRSVQTNQVPICFTCNKKGHLARDCWHKQTNQAGPSHYSNYKNNRNNNQSYKSNKNNYNHRNHNKNEPQKEQSNLNSEGPMTSVGQRTV